MKNVETLSFGRQTRFDGKPGYQIVTPTTMEFVERNSADIRLRRVRVFDPNGSLVSTFLQDTMGVLFCNMPDVADDWQYLERIKGRN